MSAFIEDVAKAVNVVLRPIERERLQAIEERVRREEREAVLRIARRHVHSGHGLRIEQKVRGYADAQARHIFRELIDTPADVSVSEREIHVHFHRRAHLPIIIASGILDSSPKIPWWHNHTLRTTA